MNLQPDTRKEITVMAQPSSAPMRRTWLPRLFKVINVPMRLILSLPFATPLSRNLMLLSFTGRKTGKRYRQPVSYVPDGDTLLTPGGGKWKLNLREDQPVWVRLRGRDVLLRPEFVTDVDEVERLLRKMMTVNPRVTAFVPVMGPDGQIDRHKLEAGMRYGFRIIRWHFA
jgi:deazaflavin-dependent oxidoreductase (nitroreductase family)